ncbi:hypothetical protein L1987_83641 [Smallanthus sonchifolius]|uniref:Uncharacterized protein n=1 Tax=Smallanthus sonchifolius TaxID=185202 RepID=A0ACB8YD52_9ASTR|nr:hypothetical protein L1987_83641 [Smallanthus sonchifolius]
MKFKLKALRLLKTSQLIQKFDLFYLLLDVESLKNTVKVSVLKTVNLLKQERRLMKSQKSVGNVKYDFVYVCEKLKEKLYINSLEKELMHLKLCDVEGIDASLNDELVKSKCIEAVPMVVDPVKTNDIDPKSVLYPTNLSNDEVNQVLDKQGVILQEADYDDEEEIKRQMFLKNTVKVSVLKTVNLLKQERRLMMKSQKSVGNVKYNFVDVCEKLKEKLYINSLEKELMHLKLCDVEGIDASLNEELVKSKCIEAVLWYITRNFD